MDAPIQEFFHPQRLWLLLTVPVLLLLYWGCCGARRPARRGWASRTSTG